MNTDFFPTVFDYAGIQIPEGLPGHSIRPLVERKPNAKGHDLVVSQNDLAPISGRSGKVYGRMLRTSRYKYIRFSKGAHKEQFFDEMLDPGELNDLSLKDSHITELENHRDLLDTWILKQKDPFPNAICEEDLHPAPLPTAVD
jgi:arylsulfatase A-like enzyme